MWKLTEQEYLVWCGCAAGFKLRLIHSVDVHWVSGFIAQMKRIMTFAHKKLMWINEALDKDSPFITLLFNYNISHSNLPQTPQHT